MALGLEPGRHPTHAVTGRPGVLFIQPAHQLQVLPAHTSPLIVPTGPGPPHQLTRPSQAEPGMRRLEQAALGLSGPLQLFF
jgi:hypothetical protein